MKKILPLGFFALFIIASCTKDEMVPGDGMLIGHECIDLASIPDEWIGKAKENLHIAYGHTSHGSQITSGMTGLAELTLFAACCEESSINCLF